MADDRLTNTDYVWNQLDYKHDALIEASAGTGKTYALESIVLKLICDKGYDAKNILLVTFTEKAAGELKDRVRKALTKAGRLPPDFDEMTICTIHSFCQRLLSEYAFENGVPMRCEIGGDSKSLAHQAVSETLKSSQFAVQSPGNFYDIMSKSKVTSIGKLIKAVEKLVLSNGSDDLRQRLYSDVAKAEMEIVAAHAALCSLNHGNVGACISQKANMAAKPAKDFYGWLSEAFEFLASPRSEGFCAQIARFPGNVAVAGINPKVDSWDGVSVKNGRSKPNLFDLNGVAGCREPLERLLKAVKDLIGAKDKIDKGSNEGIRNMKLLLSLAGPARATFETRKKSLALLTFDDMIARAAEVVMKAPQTDEEKKAKDAFFKSIRERYRVALVDEFQDTDQKQWDIFRTLFSWKDNKVEGGMPGFLLVVGDPKQAIYSFRGADVKVYCDARGKLTEEDKAGADGKPKWRKTLDETYRSKKSLIDAFNVFFGDDGVAWFKDGKGGEGIAYENVHYPRRGNDKFDGILEESEPTPVMLLESMPRRVQPSASNNGVRFGNKTTCLPVFMENAAKEMLFLSSLVPAYTLKDTKPEDPLPRFRYGDMCVLVEGKTDAAIVRRVLARHGIPYGQYKQQGLYDSAEAEGVLALFDYLANPSGRGNQTALLISPLFGVHPSELGKRSPEEEKAFDAFIEQLQDYAREKRWNELFERVMSDDCTAMTCPQGDVCAFNRTRAATRQIFDALLAERGRLAGTVADFASVLRAWRKNDQAAGEDGSLYRKESAADRVQIMTMHASKGLQFPIVFLAYGFANQVKKETSDEEKPAALQERRRLLYVALTRAEHRLYLPWSRRAWAWSVNVTENKKDEKGKVVKDENGKEVKITYEKPASGIGSAGSALLSSSDNGFLGKAIQVYFKDRQNEAFAPERTLGGEVNKVGARIPRALDHAKRVTPPKDCGITIPGLKGRRVKWDSFSSLQKHSSAIALEIPVVAAGQEIVAEGGAAHETEPQDRTVKADTLLPRNNVSGNVFHEIMETLCKNDKARGEVDFETACDEGMEEDGSALMALIRQTMRRNLLANREKGGKSTEKTLLRIVQNALKTKIVIGSTPEFKLKEIPKKDRLAEVEFVASENHLLDLPTKREGALNGKVDLLVRRGDKVFILDWKTNSLTDYTDSDVIEAAMDEAGYHLQYQLYSLATSAWLRNCGLTLAGAAYLFVRGGEVGSECGVFPKGYDATSVDNFRKGISKMEFFSTGKEAE